MEPKVCLALGGGAARGLAHLGVLKVLEDARVTIDMITGTSLGALIGGLYASNPDASYWTTRVEQFLRSFRSRKTRLEFIRRLEQPTNNRRGFFSDMANLIRKGYFWGVTATKPAFISGAGIRRVHLSAYTRYFHRADQDPLRLRGHGHPARKTDVLHQRIAPESGQCELRSPGHLSSGEGRRHAAR